MSTSTTVMTSSVPQTQDDEYTPSHPNFDRSNLSDSQYIEQLIFENRELQAIINKQNAHITKLTKQLEKQHPQPQTQSHSQPQTQPSSQPISVSSSESSLVTSSIVASNPPTSPQRVIPKSPRRAGPVSPRPQRSNHSANSFALATPVEEQQQHEKQQQPKDNDDEEEEEHMHDIPIRSSRRRRNSLENKPFDKKASYISLDSSVASQFPNSLSNGSLLSSNKVRDEPEEELSRRTTDDVSSIRSANGEDHLEGHDLGKGVLDTTINTIESMDLSKMDESQFSTLESTKSHTEASSTTAASARIYTQSKSIARSSSSVGSTYKSSRIKPPGLQKKPSENSIVDLAPPTSLKTAVANLGSPVESRSPQSQYDTPPSQSSSTFSHSNSNSNSNSNSTNSQLDPPYELSSANAVTSTTTLTGTSSSSSQPTPKPTLNLPAQQPYILQHGVSTPITQQQVSYDTVTPRPSLQSPAGSSSNLPRTPQTPGSSFNVLHTPKADMDESSLFIKPDDFQTIFISVVSTITVNSMNQASKRSDDPNITITINDRETEKEMWKIRKTISQLGAFDQEIRPILEYFGLPPLPDKQSFFTSTPAKIETRRLAMQNYFNSIFVMPHIPRMVLYNICKFLSLDFVNPLDDFKSGARKEGFLVRRYKGLGTNWKIRWCQVDGPYMEIYENPGGPILEQIRLSKAQIGRQSTDSVAEDKGYRHAFLIMESQSGKKLHSSAPKHFFCAETDEERDDWVTSLIEFTEGSNDSSEAPSPQQQQQAQYPPQPPQQQPPPPFSQQPQQQQQQQQYLGNGRNESRDNLLTPNSRADTASANDEIRSIQNGYTPVSIAASFADSITNYTTTLIDDVTKKPKKRSIFPFRTRANTVDSEASLATAPSQQPYQYQSQQQQPVDEIPPPPTSSVPQEDLQQVLDKMNLGEEVIPKSIFGKDVHAAFDLSNASYHGKQIPSVCFRCLDFLERTHAVYEEGLFRISGRKAVITELQQQFDKHLDIDLFSKDLGVDVDIATIAGLFKLYLRMLPAPLIKLDAKDLASGDLRLIRYKLSHGDTVSNDLTFSILYFLNQVIRQSHVNKMNLRNICIVFEPTLNVSSEILSYLLEHFNECFV